MSDPLLTLVEKWKQDAREYRLDAAGDGTLEGETRKRGIATGYVRCADELEAALRAQPRETPQTCQTCRWFTLNTNQAGASLGDGRCLRGVRVGSPTRTVGGLYVPASFGCTLHEPAPSTPERV